MLKKERLYDALGELIYAVAKADGIIQDEEMQSLEKILSNHKWASSIKWSFDYEKMKNHDVEDIYAKAINHCHSVGPSPEYIEFIDVLNQIAAASKGIDADEQKVINSFSQDLINRFKKDIKSI